MGQLMCDVCLGSNIIKDGNEFVCQDCGCKYTLDQVRSMISGTATALSEQDSPTLNVSVNTDTEIHNKTVNARRAFEVKDYHKALELYDDILNLDSNNIEAILYRGLCLGYISSVSNSAQKNLELKKSYEIVTDIAHSNYGDTKDYFDFCENALTEMHNLISMLYLAYARYLSKTEKIADRTKLVSLSAGVSLSVDNYRNYVPCVVNLIDTIISVEKKTVSNVLDFSAAGDGLWKTLDHMLKTACEMHGLLTSDLMCLSWFTNEAVYANSMVGCKIKLDNLLRSSESNYDPLPYVSFIPDQKTIKKNNLIVYFENSSKYRLFADRTVIVITTPGIHELYVWDPVIGAAKNYFTVNLPQQKKVRYNKGFWGLEIHPE